MPKVQAGASVAQTGLCKFLAPVMWVTQGYSIGDGDRLEMLLSSGGSGFNFVYNFWLGDACHPLQSFGFEVLLFW
jgi:hypothetical protein